MNLFELPWIEIAIVSAMIGSATVSRFHDPDRAFRWGLVFTGIPLACAVLAWLAFYVGTPLDVTTRWSLQPRLFGRQLFVLDELSAPLVPAVALFHFLTALATARTHMRRYSFSWSLAAEAGRIALFSSHDPWTIVALLSISTIPPYVELRNRHRPSRVYVIHMMLFVVSTVGGWALVESVRPPAGPVAWWATLPLVFAVIVRCGIIPAQCWMTDWFEHASLGIALLFAVPLSGVYAATRLLLPVAPESILWMMAFVALLSAVYAAGMAATQRETRRFFAYLLLSHSSLIMVGLMLHSKLSLTGSLCLWFSVIISLGGFGLTLRALEARFGRLSLSEYHGLYEHTSTLAVFFMVTGLAGVGFPLTLGFISTELLADGAVEVNPLIGIAVVAAATLNGIAVLRAYFLLFTGAQHVSSVSLKIGTRERIAVLTMTAIILGGGLFPQPGVLTRARAAEEVLENLPARRMLITRGDRSVETSRPGAKKGTNALKTRRQPPSSAPKGQGSSRMRISLKSIGEPSASRQK